MLEVGQHTETINQQYLVEALQGPKHPSNYLDRFPDGVFNTSPDSVLYKLIYALIGPAGVASLKKGYFEARLKFEELGLESSELEKFYANPMGFGRFIDETYAENPEGLLNNDIWSKVKSQDQAYRNRVLDFLHGARLGGTPEGMRYAAKSALNHDVEIIEGYQYIFDQNADQIIGIKNAVRPNALGTYSTEAFAIAPNPETSSSSVQTIKFNPIPDIGTFTIKYEFEETEAVSVSGTALDLQKALTKLQSIQNNVLVSGTVASGFKVQFVGQLSNQRNVSILSVDASNVSVTSGKPCVVTVQSNSGVLSPNGEDVVTSAEGRRYLEKAIDQIRPMATYPILINGRSNWNQILFDQESIAPIASSEYAKVIRYVTGRTDVDWPENTKKVSYWIKKNVEVEAPSLKNDYKESYQDFHIINQIYAFGEDALSNVNYSNDVTTLKNYNNTHVGSFGQHFAQKIPFLQQFDNDTTQIFTPENAVADHSKPRTVTSYDLDNETSLIDGIYPSSYLKLENITSKTVNNLFWASTPKSSGAEYLEIDLGETRAVNFITMEVLKLPIVLDIQYDTLDYGNYRNYVSVTPETILGTNQSYPFVKEFYYAALDPAPWEYETYNFKDANQNMIYTRYIRIKFDRRLTGTSSASNFLSDASGNPEAWSVCVRNLRIGRNV